MRRGLLRRGDYFGATDAAWIFGKTVQRLLSIARGLILPFTPVTTRAAFAAMTVP